MEKRKVIADLRQDECIKKITRYLALLTNPNAERILDAAEVPERNGVRIINVETLLPVVEQRRSTYGQTLGFKNLCWYTRSVPKDYESTVRDCIVYVVSQPRRNRWRSTSYGIVPSDLPNRESAATASVEGYRSGDESLP